MEMILPRTTIKAVTLDADDTLWNFDEAMHAGLTQVLREIRRLAPTGSDGLTVEAMIAERERADVELRTAGASLLEIRREGFRRCLPDGHDDALVDRLKVLLGDGGRRRDMGQRGREKAERLYSREEHYRRIVGIYEQEISRAGH